MKRKAAAIARRALVGVLALAQVYLLIPVPQREAHVQYAFAASVTCPTVQGNYVAGGTLSSTTNSYWQPGAGTLASGSTTITLGTQDTAGGGAVTGVSTGDELLIMQMQDGTFNSTNTSSYGDGTGTGHGSTSIGNAGLYEYVSVSQAGLVNVTSGSVGIQGTGSGGGLLNSYYENTAANQRYQIVRVPQYTTATLSGNFKAAYWDGNTGGVAALDMASTLNLGGASIYATGDGFRGGALAYASTTPASVLNNDWRDSAQMNGVGTQPGFGTKGEGVNGTPGAVYYYNTFTTPSTPSGASQSSTPGTNADGYPNGDQGMGAPGNAGGGGTDEDPNANDQNTGGGGGANGGDGGKGGYPWTPSYSGNTSLYGAPGSHTAPGTGGYSAFNSGDIGGRGGANLSSYIGVNRVFMGGGGGSGSNNNHSENPSGNTFGSAGGVGGGIILMRLADTSGSAATLYANGTTGQAPDNDGGGGGGAGGSVVITSPQAFSGITVNVNGTAGTTAAATTSDTTYGIQHGPGGGGGGGVVVTTSNVTVSNTGGAAGTTTYYSGTSSPPQPDNYGATSGSNGVVMNGTASSTQVPGLGSGAQCYTSGTSGKATMFIGPYDSGEATYFGSDETGSYDGVQGTTNNNDFTARAIVFPTPSPQPSPQLIDNSAAGSALSPVGNTFTLSSAPSSNVEHALYYIDSAQSANYHPLTVTAVAPILPAQWTVQVCPDNGSDAPNCSYSGGTGACASTGDRNKWESNVSAAGSTNTMTFCYFNNGSNGPKVSGTAQTAKFWTVYTGPLGTYTAFSRYDGYVDAKDDQSTPAENKTHDELYAGYIPVGKTYSILNSNCKGSLQSPPASGVCPGGTIQYTLNYANIVSGGGIGSEGQVAAAFPESNAGSLTIKDDGNANGSNWKTYTNGLTEALSAGVTTANQATCGITANHCGDTTAGTTCTYNGGGAFVANATTSFACIIGGASFRLYPAGFTGQTSSGSLVFAVKVK